MRRRELLALAGAAALTSAIPARAAASPANGLVGDKLLATLTTGSPRDVRPWTSDHLRAGYQRAASAFTECRYQDAAAALTTLTTAALTTHAVATGHTKDFATGILVRAYALCSGLSIKTADAPLAWVTADRAFTLADSFGDPVLRGISARQTAIAMRRNGYLTDGLQLLESTATKLDSHTNSGPPHLLAALGSLHTAAAFNHAQTGHSHNALDAIGHAQELAARVGNREARNVTPFSTITVTEYEISVRNALGDPAGALDAARRIRPAQLPTRERSARYGLDVARAWHRHGRSDQALQALISAERYGPEDVRRPSVRALISKIASAPNPPKGAREFAVRTGVAL